MTRSMSYPQPVARLSPSELAIGNAPQVFFCPEESNLYAQCLDRMVFGLGRSDTNIVEFGLGEGSPVIHCLLRNSFKGQVIGYELSAGACEIAKARIDYYQLNDQYVVHNKSFFNQDWQPEDFHLIANPPYLTASDNELSMPALYGGKDGASITNRLIGMNFQSAMLMISTYSDPVSTIEYAISKGYQVDDFMASPMSFGHYSSEPKVKQRIAELQASDKAFYSQNIYILAGVLFRKSHPFKPDLSKELIQVMTSLRSHS